jgi:hypothetical protein
MGGYFPYAGGYSAAVAAQLAAAQQSSQVRPGINIFEYLPRLKYAVPL